MADKKLVNVEQLNKLLEALAKEENNPKNLASKIGDKDAISDRRIQIRDFLNSLEAEDPKAKEMLSSLKNRSDRALKVAGSQYANPSSPVRTNFDDLNEGKAVRVSAKDDAGRILEQKASQIDPKEYRMQQIRGVANPNIMDVQNVDIAGAKKAALEGKMIAPKGKIGGKLGALAALGSLGYQAFKGEPVMAQDVFKAGAEAVNPLPFSLEELKAETDKMNPMQAVKDMQNAKEMERAQREEAARPGALEFGKTLEDMQQAEMPEQNMSPRKAEVLKRIRGY